MCTSLPFPMWPALKSSPSPLPSSEVSLRTIPSSILVLVVHFTFPAYCFSTENIPYNFITSNHFLTLSRLPVFKYQLFRAEIFQKVCKLQWSENRHWLCTLRRFRQQVQGFVFRTSFSFECHQQIRAISLAASCSFTIVARKASMECWLYCFFSRMPKELILTLRWQMIVGNKHRQLN